MNECFVNMNDFELEDRINQAVENFESGYNCAQSVFLAYSDVLEMDLDIAKRLSTSFGGGVGRMREMCGAVSAMAMLAGFKYPMLDSNDQDAKSINYAAVQKMASLFKDEHGTIICRELLHPDGKVSTEPVASARTPDYYKTRPCLKFVTTAAKIAGLMLKGELDVEEQKLSE